MKIDHSARSLTPDHSPEYPAGASQMVRSTGWLGVGAFAHELQVLHGVLGWGRKKSFNFYCNRS